jgi:two-component system, LytTR family, sensor kinase
MLDFIQQQLNEKNKNIYFKKGRWILHILYWLYVLWQTQDYLSKPDYSASFFIYNFLFGNVCVAGFYYFYCLYLVPNFFKKNKYLQFWIYFFASMLISTAINFWYSIVVVPHYPIGYNAGTAFTLNEFLTLLIAGLGVNFLLFSAILYFMEVAEGLNTTQLIFKTTKQLSETEKHLSSMQISPVSMMSSIDKIINMLETKNSNSPDVILNFSDLLRYKLYKTKQIVVSINEEMTQLQNLFAFYKQAYSADVSVDMQIDESIQNVVVCSIVGFLEPYLETFAITPNCKCEAIVFIQNKELIIDMTIENKESEMEKKIENCNLKIQQNSKQAITFTVEKNENQYTIQICQLLQN